MRPLTDRQRSALLRLAKHDGTGTLSPELAKQLERRGVVELTGHKRTRTEWGRKVKGGTLWGVRLTTAGRNVLPLIQPQPTA